MKQLFPFLLLLNVTLSIAQESPRVQFYPPNWWTEMPEQDFQLMVYGVPKNWKIELADDAEISIRNVHYVDNPNYVFLDLRIPKNYDREMIAFNVTDGSASHKLQYPLLKREKAANIHQGINSSDLIYLIFPDRFANGNEANDVDFGLTDTRVLRDSLKTRHGGDIQGIRNKLPYIKELGATALWINPLLTNDQPWESYHGYAATDHYQIDPRFGSLNEYKALVDECHQSGMKVIIDIVFNHVGANHHLIKNLPAKDWIHNWDPFQRTSYRAPTLMDPYASEADKKIMTDGWFDHHMPDLNQKNELLANFLIQNSIWWIEMTGIDAYRIDTYAYSDEEFMADWGRTIKTHYPKFNFFGETWVHGTPIQAHFTQNNRMNGSFNTDLPAVTDFQMYYAINDALTKPQGWTEGVSKLYYTLAQDFLYEDPNRNVLFLDNHDLGRYFSMIGEDFERWKMGIGWLLTTRGIPMIYYGTEILMTGFTDPDAKVRADFPGGWKADKVDKFSASGRTALENEAFNYINKLSAFRNTSKALTQGKTTQFVPEDGLYVYFRYTDIETVMVLMNSAETELSPNMKRFAERLGRSTTATNVMTDEKLTLETLKIAPKSLLILKLN